MQQKLKITMETDCDCISYTVRNMVGRVALGGVAVKLALFYLCLLIYTLWILTGQVRIFLKGRSFFFKLERRQLEWVRAVINGTLKST